MFGVWLFPFTAERQQDGNGRRREEGWRWGSDRRNLVSVGKNPLSLHMALGDGDKYRELNGAVSDMTDERFFFFQIERARIKMHGLLCSPLRPTSVWYL